MVCRLVGAKPLSEPMLEYCYLDPWEQTSVKFWSEFKHFHSRKCIWKCRLRNGVHLSRPQWVKPESNSVQLASGHQTPSEPPLSLLPNIAFICFTYSSGGPVLCFMEPWRNTDRSNKQQDSVTSPKSMMPNSEETFCLDTPGPGRISSSPSVFFRQMMLPSCRSWWITPGVWAEQTKMQNEQKNSRGHSFRESHLTSKKHAL